MSAEKVGDGLTGLTGADERRLRGPRVRASRGLDVLGDLLGREGLLDLDGDGERLGVGRDGLGLVGGSTDALTRAIQVRAMPASSVDLLTLVAMRTALVSTHRPRDGLGLASGHDGAVGGRGDLDSLDGGGEEKKGGGEHCEVEKVEEVKERVQ